MGRTLRSQRYTKAVVICHGKSELQITRYIYSNLHLPVKVYAKDNGRHSIQITSLINELNSTQFRNIDKFADEFSVEVSGTGKNKKLVNFKLFIIMDTDDCTEQQKKKYISAEMFSKHWLYEYIVTIFNTPKLENVLYNAGIIREIKDCEKGTYYENVFPINKNKITPGTIEEIKEFNRKLDNCKDSNLPKLINYFFTLIE